tara:strand:- start:32 stop:1540 length:1509 start_codon:yes stop_codon:yes gene_type:complete
MGKKFVPSVGMLYRHITGGASKTAPPVNKQVFADFEFAQKQNPTVLSRDFLETSHNGQLYDFTESLSQRDQRLFSNEFKKGNKDYNIDLEDMLGRAAVIDPKTINLPKKQWKALYPEARLAVAGEARRLGIEDARIARESALQGPMQRPLPEGPGSGAYRRELQQEIGDDLIAAGSPGKLERQELWDIQSPTRGKYRVGGTDAFLKTYKETGQLQPELLGFKSLESSRGSGKKRYDATTAPAEEILQEANYAFPDNPELAQQLADKYLKWYRPSFAGVQEAARRAGLSPRQLMEEFKTGNLTPLDAEGRVLFDAGHLRSAQAEFDPRIAPVKDFSPDAKINRPSTSGYSARVERADLNRGGKNKPEHDINPYAAKRAGIPLNWQQDFLYWVDREMGYNFVPDWMRDFSVEELEIIWSIPNKESKENVDKIFEAFLDARKHNPRWQNLYEELQEIAKDIEEEPTLAPLGTEKGDLGDPAEGLEGPMTDKEKKAYDLEMAQQGG